MRCSTSHTLTHTYTHTFSAPHTHTHKHTHTLSLTLAHPRSLSLPRCKWPLLRCSTTRCPPVLKGGGKLSSPIASVCTTSRRIPAGSSTSQGAEKGDLIALRWQRKRCSTTTTSLRSNATCMSMPRYFLSLSLPPPLSPPLPCPHSCVCVRERERVCVCVSVCEVLQRK